MATTHAMSSSVTSSFNSRLPFCSLMASLATASFSSSPGTRPYWISAAVDKSPARSAASWLRRASSILPFIILTALIAAFSSCHWPLSLAERSLRSASCFFKFVKRSLEAASFSFLRAVSSISNCRIWRSSWSISTGIESSSMRNREAPSSMRSIALSGRKRSAMYRLESCAAEMSAPS